ncbi:MAG: NAD-binding protein [Burkholderiales bacterium]|nr:NAD-binding protein [Burkholderiales bacterium]
MIAGAARGGRGAEDAPSVVFLFLRRMRAPLIVLVASYAVAMLGLTLMPGVDAEGRPWRMDFFHAFYFFSYTATTIGFGELPHPFSDAQRLWVSFAIYLTVIAWVYAIGKIIALFQDPAFQRVLAAAQFARRVRALAEPYYIVCGYGETGGLLVDALDRDGVRTVVVDIDPGRINELDLADLQSAVPGLTADASLPQSLLLAGVRRGRCAGVVAVTNSDTANLAIAIATKVLNPRVPVVARCESREVAANMASFGTDYIIDPFERFGSYLGVAVSAPSLYLLREWLTAVPGSPLAEPIEPPKGTWVLAGFGRFGRAVADSLARHGNRVSVIEVDPEGAGRPQAVRGSGTEAHTLEAAGIRSAVGLVAGTPDDVNNLSVVITARELNPKLFVVMRKNRIANGILVERIAPDIVMQPSRIVARTAFGILTAPLLHRFFALARGRDEDWANELAARIAAVATDVVPDSWSVSVDRQGAGAACEWARAGALRIEHLLGDPADRTNRLALIPLLLARADEEILLPPDPTAVRPGDRVLFCGSRETARRQSYLVHNANMMQYVVTGEIPSSAVWRWLRRRAATPAGGAAPRGTS